MQWRNRIKGLEHIPVSQLMQHAGNWRMHPMGQQEAMAGVLRSIGISDALLVYHSDKQGGLTIIDGHLRSRMAQDASWPCLVLDVTDQEADLLLATLDPLAAMATRDEEALTALLDGLRADDQAVIALLAGIGSGPGGPYGVPAGGTPPPARARRGGDVDVTPAYIEAQRIARLEAIAALREHYGVETGGVWGCGRHRILCGDATKPEQYVKILAGVEPDAVVSDPPYGVGMDYPCFPDTLEEVAELIPQVMPLLLRYGVVAFTPGIPALWSYPKPTWLLAWVHPAPTSSGPWGFNGLNPILVYGKDPYPSEGLGRRLDHVVLSDDRRGEDLHPTTKPLKVWEWLIERVTTRLGQSILDPFLGSGTSIIAAEATGRTCYGIELDPGYVAVALDRWERTTGMSPTLMEQASSDTPPNRFSAV